MNEIDRSQVRQILNYTIAASAVVSAISYGFNNPIANKIGKIAECTFVISGAMRYCLPAPSAETQEIVQLALRFINSDTSGWNKRQIMEIIARLPPAERESVVQLVSRFPQAKKSFYFLKQLIDAINAIPRPERQDVVQQALHLVSPALDGWDVAQIINVIAAIPGTERESVVQQTLPLLDQLNKPYNYRDLSDFFKAITAISRPERQDVVQQMLHLVTPEERLFRVNNIIKIMAAIPVAERHDVVQQARPLITSVMMAWDCEQIFGAIAAIPAAERQDVVQQALPLITSVMRPWDCEQIFGAIAAIPAAERQDVVQQALPLISLEMSGLERKYIIGEVAGVSAAERQDVVQQALLLISPEMSGCHLIILAIAAIPADKREDVVQQARLVITPQMGGWDRSQIIEAIAAISAGERHGVVQQSLLVISPERSGYYLIIQAIAAIPAGERHGVVQQSLLLITREMNGLECKGIIGAVARIPAANRHAMVQAAFQVHPYSRAEYIMNRLAPPQHAPLRLGFLQRNSHLNAPNATLQERLQAWGREFETAFPGYLRATTDFALFLASLNADETEKLNEYLKKISQIEDFQMDATPEAQKGVIRRVENMLQLACVNPVFKEKMLNLVEQGVTTCRDRVLLSFNDMEVLHGLHKANAPDRQFMIAAASASMYYLLRKHALKICKEKGEIAFPDPIETILAFQIRLREDLVLPISTQRMSSEGAGRVTPAMIEEAKARMESYTTRQRIERSEDWQERMYQRFPVEAQAVRDKYQAIYAGAKKYYDHPIEQRAAWLEKWLEKHPECAELKTLVSDPNVKNYVDAGEAIQEPQGIELAHLSGILNECFPLETHEGKQ
jgi:hypothetical protein